MLRTRGQTQHSVGFTWETDDFDADFEIGFLRAPYSPATWEEPADGGYVEDINVLSCLQVNVYDEVDGDSIAHRWADGTLTAAIAKEWVERFEAAIELDKMLAKRVEDHCSDDDSYGEDYRR